MSTVKNLFMNTSWMMISQIIAGVFSFVWTILIARYLGVEDFGILSFGISFTSLITILLDLGITTYAIRDVSRDHDLASSYFGKLIPLKILLFIFTFVLSYFILILMGCATTSLIVTMVLVFQITFMSMNSLLLGGFQAFGKLKYQAISTFIYSLVQLIAVLIVIYFNLGVIYIAFTYVIGYFVSMIYLSFNTKIHITIPKFSWDMNFCKKSLQYSLPFALTAVFYSIYYSIDMVMLSYISGDYSTGIYNAAYKIMSVLFTFFPVYQNVVFPLMSKLFTNSEDLLKLSFIKSIKYLILILLPITFGITIYSEQLIVLIYGNSYLLSAKVMRILVWSVSFLFINGAASTLLNASNKEISVTKIYLIAAISNVLLNSVLITLFDYNGAALATIISEFIIFILMIYVIRTTPYLPDKSILKDIVKISVASIVMFGVLQFVDNMWIGFIVGIIVYSAVVLALRILDDDDKYLIREIVH